MDNNSNGFLYKKNDYLTFDPTTMRDLIINRLNESQIYTDQNFLGSNLSALTDIISVVFGSLMFYLNKTSTESLFSESQIYENINRIVKILNYNPAGRFTQNTIVKFLLSADLPTGSYFLPRYSYLTVNGNTYSFNQDVFFTKTTSTEEEVEGISVGGNLIYQGSFQEYSVLASGIDNETIILPLSNENVTDHLNIHVYTNNNITGKWTQWERTEDLYGAGPNDTKFEVRFNENKTYEIKFGDNINGKKLNENDTLAIFYLLCNPTAETISAGALNSYDVLNIYNSDNYIDIIQDITSFNMSTYPVSTLKFIKLYNESPSTNFTAEESTQQIKNNAPKIFSAQKRLVINSDYKYFILSQFPGLVKDVSVFNNDEFLQNHLQYLYDIGLSNPNLEKTILYNQINFGTSCNFNNIYCYLLPQNEDLINLNISQKRLILDSLNKYKTLTSQIVPMEPELFNLDFYIKNPNIPVSIEDLNQSKLILARHKNSNRAPEAIRLEARAILENFFNYNNLSLGHFLNITELNSLLSNINGVASIYTGRKDIDLKLPQISFLLWNETYPNLDVSIFSQNKKFEDFKFVKFFEIENLLNKIDVI